MLKLILELARRPSLHHGMRFRLRSEGVGSPVSRKRMRPLVCISLILFPCSLVLICPAVVPLLSRPCPTFRIVVVPLHIAE